MSLLTNLPEDCIIEIFKRCDGKSLINCRKTCKTLNEISYHRSIVDKLELNIRKMERTNEIFISLMKGCIEKKRSYSQIILQNVESLLESTEIRPVFLYALEFFGASCKILKMKNCTISLSNACLILQSFSNINILTIENSKFSSSTSDYTDELSSFDNLEKLIIVQNGTALLKLLRNRCLNLKELTVTYVNDLNENTLLFDQFIINLTHLKKLILKNLDNVSIFQLDDVKYQLDYFEIDHVDFRSIENLKKFLELQAPSLVFFKILIKHERAFNENEINLWKDIFKAICACTKLKTLVILSPNKLVPEWTFMDPVLNKTVKKLIIKDIKYSGILDAFANSLLSLNSIEYDVDDNRFQLKLVDWKILKILKLSTAISSFNFAPLLMTEDTDEFLKTTIAFLDKNQTIQELSIGSDEDDFWKNDHSIKLPVEFCRTILNTLPNLTTLKLTNINDVHLFQIIIGEYTHNIKSVSVQGFYNKTVYEIISNFEKNLYLRIKKV